MNKMHHTMLQMCARPLFCNLLQAGSHRRTTGPAPIADRHQPLLSATHGSGHDGCKRRRAERACATRVTSAVRNQRDVLHSGYGVFERRGAHRRCAWRDVRTALTPG